MSTPFRVKGTYDTPAIEFEPEKGLFKISGRSLPASSFDFYSPVMKQIAEYFESPQDLTKFEFKMEFISSSSTKIFQEIFSQLEDQHKKGVKVHTDWYYKFGDDDMKELGDDLRMDTSFPFEFVVYE